MTRKGKRAREKDGGRDRGRKLERESMSLLCIDKKGEVSMREKGGKREKL